MKKNILKVAFVAAVVLVSGINVYNSHKSAIELSDVAMANVEALAGNEIIDGGQLPGVEIVCGASSGPCWIQNGLCMKGEYMGYHCSRTDNTSLNCTPC